ncbi:MAG TPA: C39 family peptidase [bacterium]|nr:C39 family peptidase [bacterium]
MKHRLKFSFVILISVIIVSGLVYASIHFYKVEKIDSENSIPEKKNLSVPFTSQAPQADWSEPWKNACEETSIIMANNFYKDKNITAEQAKKQILQVFAIKNKEFGKSTDESMERIAEIVNAAGLDWTAVVSVNPELNAIKEEIAQNHPVIVPVDARLLVGSQYDGGPVEYHVLVISGYDDKSEEFIVQDPGTKNGKNDRYGYENFYKAINDFLPSATPSGRKAVLFTKPNN